jgi:RHS repeat-associated protein
VGELGWFSFESFQVTADTTLKVNRANGNLLVTSNDASVAAPGFGLRADRFYNGLSSLTGSLGGGWSSNSASRDVGLDDHGTYVVFFAPNGKQLRFESAGSGQYIAPGGSNMTLSRLGNTSLDSWSVTLNRTGDRYIFSAGGYLINAFDRNGVGESYEYDSNNRMVMAYHENGRYLTFGYDAVSGRMTTQSDSGGRTTHFGYDSDERLSSVEAYDGAESSFTYDDDGRLESMSLPSPSTVSGQTTVTFEYDASSRVKTVIQTASSLTWGLGLDARTSFTYGTGLTTVTSAGGHAASYAFDASGRQTSATDALQRTRSQSWSANGDILSTTDALSPASSTTYSFDSDNNATGAQLPTGAAASAVFTASPTCNSSGGTAYQVKCSTDSSGNVSAYSYDSHGNPTSRSNNGTGAAADFTIVYQTTHGLAPCGGLAGQVCSSTDGNGHVTSYEYSFEGDLRRVVPPAPLGATTYETDNLGRVTKVVDGRSKATLYGYDVRDRLVSSSYDGGGATTATYFKNGLRATMSDGSATVRFAYDAQGRLTQQSGPQSGVVSKFRYDEDGNIVEQIDVNGSTKYTYDAANQLMSVTEPGGTCPAGNADPSSASGCTKFAYDANGLETARVFPAGARVDRTYDLSGRPTRIVAKTSTGITTVDIGYGYADATTAADRTGIQSRTSFLEYGVTPGAVTTYSYDQLGRLSSAQETVSGASSAAWSYTYDNAGNRLSQSRSGATGAVAGTTSWTYNSANQIVSSTGAVSAWTYDAAGNLTQNGQSAVTYAVGSRASVQSVGSVSQTYFGGGNANRLSSGSTTYVESATGLVQANGPGSALRFVRTPSGEAIGFKNSVAHYYVKDHLGSIVGVFSPTGDGEGGYSYSPYGELRASSSSPAAVANPLRYAGGLRDSNGLYKFGARYYDPATGTFTQPDPSGQESAPYAYAANDPINNADPTGLNTAAQIINLALVAISAFLCSVLPVIGCVAVGALFGAIGGGLNAAADAADRGETTRQIQAAFVEGAAWGALGGAVAGLAGGIGLKVARIFVDAR